MDQSETPLRLILRHFIYQSAICQGFLADRAIRGNKGKMQS